MTHILWVLNDEVILQVKFSPNQLENTKQFSFYLHAYQYTYKTCFVNQVTQSYKPDSETVQPHSIQNKPGSRNTNKIDHINVNDLVKGQWNVKVKI